MSFLKIKDTNRRDALGSEFLKTRKNIQNDFCAENLDMMTFLNCLPSCFNQ